MNFASQNSRLRFGVGGLHFGQRCQKHPWTKTASFALVNTTSGRPGRPLKFTRYPSRPAARSALLKATSGAVFVPRFARMVLSAFLFTAGGLGMRLVGGTDSSSYSGTGRSPFHHRCGRPNQILICPLAILDHVRMDAQEDTPDTKFNKSRRNQVVQKAGLSLLLGDPRFQAVDLPTKKRIVKAFDGEGRFGTHTFDLIMKPLSLPPVDSTNVESLLPQLTLVEMKATRKAIQGPELNKFFFGATENERRMAEQLGHQYLFAFVVLSTENQFRRPFARLLTLAEVAARTSRWRTQFQVSFKSDLHEPLLVADGKMLFVLGDASDL